MRTGTIAGRGAAIRRQPLFRRPSAVPGFGLTLGLTISYLSLIVLIPLSALVLKASSLGPGGLVAILAEERVQAALKLTFGAAFLASLVSAAIGVLIAWVLTRYRFPARRLLDAAIDLPFALPTAVAGIALTAIYAPDGWIGRWLDPLGIQVAFTPLGIMVALIFVGLPFSVRTVEPLIAEIDREIEEASATLGAGAFQTVWRVLIPPLLPAILTGLGLTMARAVGEYGSVIFIAGNMPLVSEIAPLLIVIKLEEFDYAGATGIAVAMLAISFLLLLCVNLLQAWSRRRLGYG